MHCPFLLQDTDSFRYGFSVLRRRHAEECLPQLYMSQNPPCQELVAKDLHGTEWHFWHIFRGQPKRYLLTTSWSVFVSSKRLVARDAFCWPDWILDLDLELPEGSLALSAWPLGLNENVMTCFYNDTPLPL